MDAKQFLEQNSGNKAAIDYFSKMHIEISMEEYADYKMIELIKWLKNNPGQTEHTTPEFILKQFKKQ